MYMWYFVYDSGVVGGSQVAASSSVRICVFIAWRRFRIATACCRGRGRGRDKLALGVVRGDRYCGPSHIGMGSLDSVVLPELPEGVVFRT